MLAVGREEQAAENLPRPLGLGGELARRLQATIRDGALAPGDKLPTEKQLAEQYGVSRAVVREAIARLKSEGYVASRQGAGAFVVARPGQTSFRMTPGDLRHAFELRGAIEVAAAELAARRCQPQDLVAIRAAFAAMQAALAAPGAEAAQSGVVSDDAFHAAIAAATHNPLIQRFLDFLAHQFSETRQLTWAGLPLKPGNAAAAQAEHAALLAALEAADPIAAAAAARAHVAGAAARFGLLQEDTAPC